MINDNQRRDAAREIRRFLSVPPSKRAWDNDGLQTVGRLVGAYVGENILARLADLIDPTCHIVLKPSDSDFNDEPHYLCSRCGKAGIDVYERDDYTLGGIVDHANYCSYCGARVVTDDD